MSLCMVFVFNICCRYSCLRGWICSNLYSKYFTITQKIRKDEEKYSKFKKFYSSPLLGSSFYVLRVRTFYSWFFTRILSEFFLCSAFVVLNGANGKEQEWQSYGLTF